MVYEELNSYMQPLSQAWNLYQGRMTRLFFHSMALLADKVEDHYTCAKVWVEIAIRDSYLTLMLHTACMLSNLLPFEWLLV